MYYRFFSVIILGIILAACTSTTNIPLNQEAAYYNMQLGLAYLQQNNTQLAKSKLLLALQQSPKDPTILETMGYFYASTGTPEIAITYYQQAIKIAPQKGEIRNNFGVFLCSEKYYYEAIQNFLLALQDKNYLNDAGAYENAGLCALKIPDQKLAKIYFQKALAYEPNRLSVKKQLAKL